MKENNIQERIHINGNWYILESSVKKNNPYMIEALVYDGLLYEYEDYAFDVSRIYDDNGKLYDGISIKFTDKTKNPYFEEMWESEAWMLGVLNNDDESLLEAKEALSENGISKLRYVVSDLIVRGWLKETE